MSLKALSSSAVSFFQKLKAKWEAKKAKRSAEKIKESPPV